MLAAALVSALLLQQAATGQVVWSTPLPAPEPVPAAAAPAVPDWARADPHGYERSECSPLIRSAQETMEACQTRVRFALASGQPVSGASNECRQEAAGDRYALQCGTPTRPDRPATAMAERTCETRPQAQPGGGVAWTEECRPAGGERESDGLKIRLGGRD